MQAVVQVIPHIVLILNQQRQVVFANNRALEAFAVPHLNAVLGKRPGELLHCAHADESTHGCGVSEFCRTCGAVHAILSSLQGSEAVRECRISQKSGDALDLRVWATPLSVAGEAYTVFSIKDIGDEKRRAALERIFLHDVLNTAGIVSSYAWMIEQDGAAASQWIGDLNRAAQRLVDEIMGQRQLLAAENGDLQVTFTAVDAGELLEQVKREYFWNSQDRGVRLLVEKTAEPEFVKTDLALLGRVIGNMVKNALEAAERNETITLAYAATAETLVFSVHNAKVMPRHVQLQIFNRSFSTKGEGRGLGTYSIKMLSERYLHGRVWFESRQGAGTTFFGEYPRTWTTP